MEPEELKKLISEQQPKEIYFDGDEFVLGFANDLTITIWCVESYGVPEWKIQSSIEKAEAKRQYEIRQRQQNEQKQTRLDRRTEFLNQFPKDQWDTIIEIMKP